MVLLKREVLMLQTVETKKPFETRTRLPDGRDVVETTTVYSYEEKWVNKWINSGEFNDPSKREDNIRANITSTTFTPPKFFVGEVQVTEAYLNSLLRDSMKRQPVPTATCQFPQDNRGIWSLKDDFTIQRKLVH